MSANNNNLTEREIEFKNEADAAEAAAKKERADLEARFLALAGLVEGLSEKLSTARTEMTEVLNKLGVDSYLQDPATKLVYKVIEPTGTFTAFYKIGYKRTAKPGEKGGTLLAKSEAEEAGFILK